MKNNSATTIMIRHLLRSAAHVVWVLFSKAHHVESAQYAEIKHQLYARAVGNAIGHGSLARTISVSRGEPLPNQLMAFQRKAAAVAETAAAALALDRQSAQFTAFVEEVWFSALAAAIAAGRFHVPQISSPAAPSSSA